MGIQRFAAADIGRIFRGQSITGLSEWQLLERYLERQDEVAFEALVARHGPMVLGVCRRMLGSQSDVEDAFQATFLVLVRRARQLGPRDAIGPWLYGVAARVALRARCEAARRRRFESIPLGAAAFAAAPAAADPELAETVDQELGRLPSKYRSPLVLCYLEGHTHEEAARLLRWPVGTVKGRLARARDLLRSRLARRGLAPTALALLASSAGDASASVPRELLESTVRSGLQCALGRTTAQVASASITSLVEGALTAMFFANIKWIGAALLIGALALAGAAVTAQQIGGPLRGKLAQRSEAAAVEAGSRASVAQNASTALPGSGAIPTSPTIEGDHVKLLALATKAELEPAQGPGPSQGFGGAGGISKPKRTLTGLAAPGRRNDPKSRLILTKLDDLVAMKFRDETPLEDLLKYIKDATKSAEMAQGIPIYVDPIGLQEAEKSLTSTITIDLEGVPLKRTLQLALRQLGLAYLVEDGMIYITSQESFDQMNHLAPAIPEESPIIEEGEKALRGELSVEEMKQWIEKYKTCLQVKSALDPGESDEEVAESKALAPALRQEIQKLTTVNDELKKKIDKLETQLTEIRQLLGQLAKQEKPEKDAKKAARVQ